MAGHRPHPSEEPSDGTESPPREAASLILLRDDARGPEVLLVRRNPEQRFMGGAWVFPGGATDAGENAAGTALRELEEEAAITLESRDELVPFSRWITPPEVRIRFDTYFFAARSPAGAEPVPDGGECVEARWVRPREALEQHARDAMELVFPTIRHLEELACFESVADGLARARRREVRPVQPRVVEREGRATVVLPGEPGY